MRYFPVYMDLDSATVLVVGGDEQAAQKIRLLTKTNVEIHVVASELIQELCDWEKQGRIKVFHRKFEDKDVLGFRMVYAATEDLQLATKVHKAAIKENIPVNVVDQPDLCTFITPAIVDRDPVTVAIGTEGAAPILAREIKAKLESWLPENYGTLAKFSQKLRGFISKNVTEGRQRRIVWKRLLSGPFRKFVLANDYRSARRALKNELSYSEKEEQEDKLGSVALIGCGPGDPGLLTLKAQQRMQEADVLVVDRLVNPDILEYARRDAERIFVGKAPGEHTTPQTEINRILLREAMQGKTVARLKGGDPFVFGRASEELIALQPHGIPVEVVPGITASHACAASIGLPVTMREQHRVFSILTGATVDGVPDHDWRTLAIDGHAFAVYMGVRTSGEIQKRLLNAGINPGTPIVIVENGTRENERAISATIQELEMCVDQSGIKGPAIIFIGMDWSQAGISRPAKVEKFKPVNIVSFSGCRQSEKTAG